jgi:VanZ family protein
MVRFLRYLLPALFWAGLIFASSAVPTRFFPGVEYPWVPKVVHVLFFFFLCLLLILGLRHQQTSPLLARWSLITSIMICMTFGILDEVHQMFVPGRHPRLTDVLLDVSGAILMALTFWIWSRLQSLRRERATP